MPRYDLLAELPCCDADGRMICAPTRLNAPTQVSRRGQTRVRSQRHAGLPLEMRWTGEIVGYWVGWV